ncbi:MAG TPA: hypothetical protein VHB73_07655 [Alphaproteobacteria bacterium]|nr:hypothetical protein [Alphaproteobacteria bacterium]
MGMLLKFLIPPKSAMAGGLAGVISYLMLGFLQARGVNVDGLLPLVNALLAQAGSAPLDAAGLHTLITGGVGTLVTWVVSRVFPPSITNIALHYDSVIKTLSKIDMEPPDSPHASRH